MDFLRTRFSGRLISLRGDSNWLARYTDLDLCNFFLGRYLKSKVYNDRPRILEALKNKIQANIAEIYFKILQRVHENFRERLLQCIQGEGAYSSDIIFKTKLNLCFHYYEMRGKSKIRKMFNCLWFIQSRNLCVALHPEQTGREMYCLHLIRKRQGGKHWDEVRHWVEGLEGWS